MATGIILSEVQVEEAIKDADAAVAKNDIPAVVREWGRLIQTPDALKTDRVKQRINSYRDFVRSKEQKISGQTERNPTNGNHAPATPRRADHSIVVTPQTNVSERMERERAGFRKAAMNRFHKSGNAADGVNPKERAPMDLTPDELFGFAKIARTKKSKSLQDKCDAIIALGNYPDDQQDNMEEAAKNFVEQVAKEFSLLARIVLRLKLESRIALKLFGIYSIRKGLPEEACQKVLESIERSIDSFEKDEDEIIDSEDDYAGPSVKDLQREKRREKKEE